MNNQMIPYNVSETQLILPEYGRNIQKMIDHCVSIEDREQRTKCAHSIAETMATLFPSIVGEGGNRQKIWDHINIMSRFALDIDFPYDVITSEELKPDHTKIPYNSNLSRYRNYGKNLQEMIRKVAEMDNCIEKDHLIFLIANQMKKLLLLQNPENATDSKVFDDIAKISEGRIVIDPLTYRLNEYVETAVTKNKNKKKK